MGDGLVCPPFRKSQRTLASHRAPAQVRALYWRLCASQGPQTAFSCASRAVYARSGICLPRMSRMRTSPKRSSKKFVEAEFPQMHEGWAPLFEKPALKVLAL